MKQSIFPFDIERVTNGLAMTGFRREVYLRKYRRVFFSRQSESPGVFEQLEVTRASSKEVVCPMIRLTVVPGAEIWVNMFEEELLSDVAHPDEDSRIRSKAEAAAWEDAVIRATPIRCAELASKVGARLSDQTIRAQRAAAFYVSRLPPQPKSMADMDSYLRAQADSTQLALARKKLDLSVLTTPYESDDEEDRVFHAYWIVSLLTVFHGDDAIRHGFFPSIALPIDDIELAWCFQIMASTIQRLPFK